MGGQKPARTNGWVCLHHVRPRVGQIGDGNRSESSADVVCVKDADPNTESKAVQSWGGKLLARLWGKPRPAQKLFPHPATIIFSFRFHAGIAHGCAAAAPIGVPTSAHPVTSEALHSQTPLQVLTVRRLLNHTRESQDEREGDRQPTVCR